MVVPWIVVVTLLFIWHVMKNELNFRSYACCETFVEMYSAKSLPLRQLYEPLSLTLATSPMVWLGMCVRACPAVTRIKLRLVRWSDEALGTPTTKPNLSVNQSVSFFNGIVANCEKQKKPFKNKMSE